MKAMIDIGATAPKNKELVLECQGSSIGTYSTQWLNEFYSSARGDSAQAWLDKSKASRAKLPFPPVKILFPTAQFVKDSVLGEAVRLFLLMAAQFDAIRTDCDDDIGRRDDVLQTEPMGGQELPPRAVPPDEEQARARAHALQGPSSPTVLCCVVTMVAKIEAGREQLVLGTFRDKRSGGLGRYANTEADSDSENEGSGSTGATGSGSQQKLAGWVYVGSHNFTPSAWGTLSGSGFNPTLNVSRPCPSASTYASFGNLHIRRS